MLSLTPTLTSDPNPADSNPNPNNNAPPNRRPNQFALQDAIMFELQLAMHREQEAVNAAIGRSG